MVGKDSATIFCVSTVYHPTRLLIFRILPACTFIPPCSIIRETRLALKKFFALHFITWSFQIPFLHKKNILEVDDEF